METNLVRRAGDCANLLKRWKNLLGDGVVLGPALEEALVEVGEFPRRRVMALLRPRNTAELRAVVAAAAEFGGAVPLYPFSTGRNWGLGSRQPTAHGCALLDLGRLNRVRELNLERGCAVIEPGVTQGELSRRLEGTSFMLNVTNAGAETSILGNALERGVGFARQRTDDLLALEVVLAGGQQVRVGAFWDAPGAATPAFHYRHGVGPDLLPLFCQSNLGIVTAGVVSLLPRPECVRVFRAAFPEQSLDRALEVLRLLHRDGLLNNVSRVYQTAAVQGGPGATGNGFVFFGAFSGRRTVADAVEELVLKELCQAEVAPEAVAFQPASPDRVAGVERHPVEPFLGRPGGCGRMPLAFGTRDCDLDRTSADGFLLFLPVVPFEVGALRRALALSEAIACAEKVRRKADLNILGSSCVDLVITLHFPRTPDGVHRGHTALDRLHRAFSAEGFFPYRVDIDHQEAEQLYGPGPYRDTLRQLKRALDPQGIFAPGRYLPS